jgi:hypothetical protein
LYLTATKVYDFFKYCAFDFLKVKFLLKKLLLYSALQMINNFKLHTKIVPLAPIEVESPELKSVFGFMIL